MFKNCVEESLHDENGSDVIHTLRGFHSTIFHPLLIHGRSNLNLNQFVYQVLTFQQDIYPQLSACFV